MKKRVTLSDVAEIAGVSMMTVSRVINNKSGVSERMRRRILDIAKEIDYYPNQIARGLVTNQTSTIGLVVPDNTNPFFANIARGVEDLAFERGYNIFLINTAEDVTREKKALDSLWQKGVDGLILCSSRLPNIELEKQIERFPATILINRELKKPIPSSITINLNDLQGAQLAVTHFLNLGKRNIAHISGPANSISGQKRLAGFKLALNTAEIPFNSSYVQNCAPDTESGYEAGKELLTAHPEIDAIYAFNDLIAVGLIQYCLEVGKHIPQEIAIIGVDDIPLASLVRPRLTTLHVNQNYIGKLAMRTLLEIIMGESSPLAVLIEPELLLRESA